MGLIRLILFLAIGYFLWLNVKTFLRKQEKTRSTDGSRNPQEPINVVKCRYCSIHLPENEAVADGKLWFCNNEHRRLWLNKQQG